MQPPTVHLMGTTGGMVTMSTRPAKMMNLMDAVVTCLQKYIGFEGRASRSEYWWFFLFTIIASFISGIIDAMLFGIELTDPTPISWALQIGLFLPSIAVGIRRIHDQGLSGWYCIIPIYNIILFATEGKAVPNIYGPVPTNTLDGKSVNQHIVIQEPMQQQYQQPTAQTVSQVSDDGYWALVDGNWVPTELQNEAIAKGANPHVGNTHANTMAQTSEQVVIYSSPSSGGVDKTLIVIVGIVIGIALLVVLAGVLYVWASSLAGDDNDSNLVGTWTNPSDKLELQSNGDAKESTGTFESWYTVGENLYFEDEDYSYKFRYSLVDDIMFLAPYDENSEVIEDDCVVYLQGLNGESQSYYTDRIEQADTNGNIPYWCNP